MIARFSARRVAMPRLTPDQLLQELAVVDDLLIVQDLDGVCMQLVKDPLTRRMDRNYVEAAALLEGAFVVLTNGEHERRRGVNRLVEQALEDQTRPAREGLYLPGLAAGGVQLQDRHGNVSHPGVSDAEMAFLAAAPARMEALLKERLPAARGGLRRSRKVCPCGGAGHPGVSDRQPQCGVRSDPERRATATAAAEPA